LFLKTTVAVPIRRQILRQINKLFDVMALSDEDIIYLKEILRGANLL
jgi:hypothetical protein